MIINMIVAMDKSNGIGLNNKLPWNFAKDMKFFKNKTIGNGNNAIIMGKNTFLSIGEKPLKGRKNYVISRTITSCNNNVIVLKDPDLITTLSKYDEVWIIGGSQLYNYFLSKQIIYSYCKLQYYILEYYKKYLFVLDTET